MYISWAMKTHKLLVHDIHQAPTEKTVDYFFLRHRESECLWLLNSQIHNKKLAKTLFMNESLTKDETEKFIIIKY